MEKLKHNLQSEKEMASIWTTLTGIAPKEKAAYFSAPVGYAKIELYPDYLNGRHRLLLRDFDYHEDNDDYLDGIQEVAEFVKKAQESGIRAEFSVADDYSDADSIKTDVEALLAPVDTNQMVA